MMESLDVLPVTPFCRHCLFELVERASKGAIPAVDLNSSLFRLKGTETSEAPCGEVHQAG